MSADRQTNGHAEKRYLQLLLQPQHLGVELLFYSAEVPCQKCKRCSFFTKLKGIFPSDKFFCALTSFRLLHPSVIDEVKGDIELLILNLTGTKRRDDWHLIDHSAPYIPPKNSIRVNE